MYMHLSSIVCFKLRAVRRTSALGTRKLALGIGFVALERWKRNEKMKRNEKIYNEKEKSFCAPKADACGFTQGKRAIPSSARIAIKRSAARTYSAFTRS